jgi:hypothetical protein
MKKLQLGLALAGMLVLGFGSSAKASGIGFGPSLALDTIPVAFQFEYDLSQQWSLTTGLSLLAFVNGGATYFWQDSQGGPYTSARAGVNLVAPAFTLYAHQGYRFALGERAALDLEAGLGWARLTTQESTYPYSGSYPVTRDAVLPSLALRFNIKF